MKLVSKIIFLFASLALAGCQPSTDRESLNNAKSEAQQTKNKATTAFVNKVEQGETDEQILESAETCAHLAGEFGGDQSERDKEIIREQDSLKCDQALGNLKAVKARLPKNSPLLPKVNETLKDLE